MTHFDSFWSIFSTFSDEDGAVIRPLPKIKQALSDPLHLPHVVQLLLTFDPTLVERVAALLHLVLEDNSRWVFTREDPGSNPARGKKKNFFLIFSHFSGCQLYTWLDVSFSYSCIWATIFYQLEDFYLLLITDKPIDLKKMKDLKSNGKFEPI